MRSIIHGLSKLPNRLPDGRMATSVVCVRSTDGCWLTLTGRSEVVGACMRGELGVSGAWQVGFIIDMNPAMVDLNCEPSTYLGKLRWPGRSGGAHELSGSARKLPAVVAAGPRQELP